MDEEVYNQKNFAVKEGENFMKKWETESRILEVYAVSYAEERIWSDIHMILYNEKNRMITKQQREDALNEICPDWTEDDIYNFAYSERESLERQKGYMQLRIRTTDTWEKYYDEGKKACFENLMDKYGELQNEIVDYVEKKKILENRALKKEYYYGAVITMARKLQQCRENIYDNTTYESLLKWSPLNRQGLKNLAEVIENIRFNVCNRKLKTYTEYIEEKVIKNVQEFERKKQVTILIDTSVELIYRMYINGEQNLNKVKNMLKETDNPSLIAKYVEDTLQEYIAIIDELLAKKIYPVDVILQILGCPALSHEEYDSRVAAMRENVKKLLQ